MKAGWVKEAREKRAERARKEEETGKEIGGRPPQVPVPEEAKAHDKAQRNFTDPDSRIMMDGATKAFVQGYNAQIAVDGEAQVQPWMRLGGGPSFFVFAARKAAIRRPSHRLADSLLD